MVFTVPVTEDLKNRLQGKPLFVSNELPHYGTVQSELCHKIVPVAPMGKRGRPRNPEKVVDADLDNLTVHKTREGGRVIKVECKVVHGNKKRISARLADSPIARSILLTLSDPIWTDDSGTCILHVRHRWLPDQYDG